MIVERGALLIILFMLLSACRKDAPERPVEVPITISGTGGVYITNEGNFQWGNAGVSYVDLATNTVTEDLYAPANGVGLGDVCQSMRLFNGKAYLVVNNSGKIVVADANTFSSTATITGMLSPRYFLPVSNSKAYVTDLYADHLSIVDLNSNTITGTIRCAAGTEELVLALGKAFVTCQSRDQVYVIDTATDMLVDSVTVSAGGNSIVEDANGKLWVACSSSSSALHRIDPQTHSVEATFAFPSNTDRPTRLDINGGNDTLYFLNNGVHRMPITSSTLPSSAFIPAGDRNFYGIGIEPSTGIIHVSDAMDYVQRGTIYRYRPDGSLVNSFRAGIIPGDFYFR